MSAMMNRKQGDNQKANPKIWGLMEDTKMESTNTALTGQSNTSWNTAKCHLIKTVRVMAMGAMLATSVLLSGSTASADGAGKPLAKEQVTLAGNWDTYADARDILPKVKQVSLVDSDFDAYVDARDIPNSGERFNFSNKLVSINTGAAGNWDTYADARDILPKVKQVSLVDSDFDAYVDARDIR